MKWWRLPVRKSIQFFWLIGFLFLLDSSACTGQTPASQYSPPPSLSAIRQHLFFARHKRVPLQPEVKSMTEGQFQVERGRFHSEATEVVPFLIYKSANATGRLPVVIVLHGTGGNKEGTAGTCRQMAENGMMAIAIDARYHGERIPGGAHGAQEYQEAILQAWHETNTDRQAHPFYYDMVYDLWRTVDYLQSRSDVDGKRIGMIGFSMGGIQTWLAAAADPRIKVAVPAIGVQCFRWSLENEKWQGRAATIPHVHEVAAKDLGESQVNAKVCRAVWNKLIPGMLDTFDCPQMLKAIAPRPLLILNGEKDPNNPLPGAEIAFEAARSAYQHAGVEDRLQINVATGVAHAVTPEQNRMAIEWLKRWLIVEPNAQSPRK